MKNKINEKDLLEKFSKIQEIIDYWNNKFPLPQNLPPVETEDKKPYIIQPFYTYQIHAID